MTTEMIKEYDFFRFLKEFQRLVVEGYRLDNTLENYPLHVPPTFYKVGLSKGSKVVQKPLEEVSESVEDVEEVSSETKKRGRKAKE